MEYTVQQIELLLLVAAMVAMVAKRLNLPWITGLVLAGVGLSFMPVPLNISLTRELVFFVLLPPLIFEAAFYIHWNELKKDLPTIGTFATLGVLFSAAVVALGMHHFASWELGPAMCFGALIAATDPVSVIATFKEAQVKGRLRLLVEAESVINDGTAAVFLLVALAFATGGEGLGYFGGSTIFLVSVLGGIACGGAVAYAALLAAGRTDDHLVEITFTTVAAYGSFLLAEHFHMSGIIACMTAGLVLGNKGSLGSITDKGREAVISFWEYASFAANAVIFLLIGVEVAKHDISSLWQPALLGIGLVMVGRAVAIYPCAALFRTSKLKIKMKHQHVLFWGGMRGALALALALGLPQDMPQRADIIAVSFAVVIFSVLIQAPTMNPLLRKFREIPRLVKVKKKAAKR